jgi:hypothetical protein
VKKQSRKFDPELKAIIDLARARDIFKNVKKDWKS